MSLLDKAQACIEMSRELLLAGDNAGSLECALEAAKYLQLIRLFRQNLVQGFVRERVRQQWENLEEQLECSSPATEAR
jgi:hypothetical protein